MIAISTFELIRDKMIVCSFQKYSGDLNNTNIWLTIFHLSSIQMSSIQMAVQYSDHHSNTDTVFKWCSEYWTIFSPVFKWHLNNGPYSDKTNFNHLNTRPVQYSDPHCNIT